LLSWQALASLQSVEAMERREGRAVATLRPEERQRRRGALRIQLREEGTRRGWPWPRYCEVGKERTAPSIRRPSDVK
jgi:hypothetical protein